MKKKLICDIDSTINNHWKRIEKWSKDNPHNEISWRAFTMEELMKDDPLPNSKEVLSELSKKYSIHFLTARGSMLIEAEEYSLKNFINFV